MFIERVDALLERTRFAKEKGRDPDRGLTKLRKVSNKPLMFIHFSTVNKLGINPGAAAWADNPVGVYAYPLNKKWISNIENDRIPFGSGREFIHAFQVKASAKKRIVVIQSGGRIRNYDEKRFEQDLAALKKRFKGVPKELRAAQKSRMIAQTPFAWLWHLVRSLTNSPTKASKLFLELGIHGVVDEGTGLIHSQEPEQAVFFNMRSLEQVVTVTNQEVQREFSLAIKNAPDEYQEWRLAFIRNGKKVASIDWNRATDKAIDKAYEKLAKMNAEWDKKAMRKDRFPFERELTDLVRYSNWRFELQDAPDKSSAETLLKWAGKPPKVAAQRADRMIASILK